MRERCRTRAAFCSGFPRYRDFRDLKTSTPTAQGHHPLTRTFEMSSLSQLSSDPTDLIQQDRARTPLYTDPAIFEAEMTKIFKNTWVWVAHASEIPGPGDFKMSQV